MGEVTDVVATPQPWAYREVERGVQLFSAQGAVTGSTGGGDQTVRFRMNPDTNSSFSPFVAITRVSVITTTAAPTGGMLVRTTGGAFTRGVTYALPIAAVELAQMYSATQFSGGWYGFVNLGRGVKGDTQSINCILEEINTMVTEVTIEGLISDHPITGRWWLSA